jgi:hypothetical protein
MTKGVQLLEAGDNLNDVVKGRIQTALLELIPDEKWDEYILQVANDYLGTADNKEGTLYRMVRDLVEEEFKKRLREWVKVNLTEINKELDTSEQPQPLDFMEETWGDAIRGMGHEIAVGFSRYIFDKIFGLMGAYAHSTMNMEQFHMDILNGEFRRCGCGAIGKKGDYCSNCNNHIPY